MKKCILGISSFGHDTSACIVDSESSQVIFASAQERYSNIKFDSHIPFYTINECLKVAEKYNYEITDAAIASNHLLFMGNYFFNELNKNILNFDITLKLVEFLKFKAINYGYFNSILKSNKFLNEYLDKNFSNLDNTKIKRIKNLISWYFNWSVKHYKIKEKIENFLKNIKVHEVDHHLAHAASAYYNSGFENTNAIVLDGQGEEVTITLYNITDNNFSILGQSFWPNSLGILYLKATEHLGYKLGDEYKVMGMSAFGKDNFNQIFNGSTKIDEHGSLTFLKNGFIEFEDIPNTAHRSLKFTNKIDEIIPKPKNKNFNQNHFDFAKSLQTKIENIGLEFSDYLFEKNKVKNMCLSGGVALNGLMNNKILNSSNISDAFVYPASGDDGTSVGAAQLIVNKDKKIKKGKIKTCFLGFVEDINFDINKHDKFKKKFLRKVETKNIYSFLAKKISEGSILAICSGNAEFGPRALGARSIIANPLKNNIVEILNTKIKLREPFRPFAPICLEEHVNKFFNLNTESNFMLFICETLEKMKEKIPGVVHKDGTARVQSVGKENEIIYKILNEFYNITNIPVLINTSFNIGGEAIVNSYDDAINSFLQMDIDYLLLGNDIFEKNLNEEKNYIKPSLDEFIKRRTNTFNKINQFPNYNIMNFNYNFFDNFYAQLKQFLKQIIYKDYI